MVSPFPFVWIAPHSARSLAVPVTAFLGCRTILLYSNLNLSFLIPGLAPPLVLMTFLVIKGRRRSLPIPVPLRRSLVLTRGALPLPLPTSQGLHPPFLLMTKLNSRWKTLLLKALILRCYLGPTTFDNFCSSPIFREHILLFSTMCDGFSPLVVGVFPILIICIILHPI